MYNKNSKFATGIAIIFEIILIVTAITSILSRQWKVLALSLLTVILIILPFIIIHIANRKRIVLPSSFQLIAVVFIFLAQYLGEIMGFYISYWWWDLLLHAIFGSYGVITGLCLIKGVIRKETLTTEKRFAFLAVIFAFSFSIALGTLWEIFEFAGDYLFKANMVKGGLEDTATDLLAKTLAAFVTSIVLYFHDLKSKSL